MKNIVLITADSLRYDHVSYTGQIAETTPFLDSLIEDGVFFQNAVATGSGTSSSFPGILASALPMEYGYRGLNQAHLPLAEYFKQHDISTVGVSASTHASSLYNYHKGFENFYENTNFEKDEASHSLIQSAFEILRRVPIVHGFGRQMLQSAKSIKREVTGPTQPYELADEITNVAVEKIESAVTSRPETQHFIWIHYMEPHSPPLPPKSYIAKFHSGGYTRTEVYELWQRWWKHRPPLWVEGSDNDGREIFSEEEVQAIREFYQAQVRFLDDQLQRLWEGLTNLGIEDETTLLFTSDHGEEFFEHGDLAHRQKLYDELIHVPLIAYHGGGDFTNLEDCGTPVSLTDLGPTIADLFGVDIPKTWQGKSFAPVFKGDDYDRSYAISELCHKGLDEGYGGDIQPEKAVISVRTANWKFIRNRQKGSRELYDLTIDPGEQTNVYEDKPNIATEVEGIVNERLEALNNKEVDQVNITEDVRYRLAQLGYTEE